MTIELLVAELRAAGFKNALRVTDRAVTVGHYVISMGAGGYYVEALATSPELFGESAPRPLVGFSALLNYLRGQR